MSDERLRLVGGEDEVEEELVRARLAPFAVAAQRYVDGALAVRGTRPVPPLRLDHGRRQVVWFAAAVVAVAAVALLVIAPRISSETAADPAPNAASHSEQPRDAGSTAVSVAPANTNGPADSEPATVLDEPTLRSLDATAQRQWKMGDLGGATRTFQRMTQHGGDHRYVELAYGDLVSLARQRGHAEQIHGLWREYLQRFPRGRFSTDARASVCGLPQAPSACTDGSGGR